MADLDTDTIRAALVAATPGPYRWAGNTDTGDVRLTSPRLDILGVTGRARTIDDPAAQSFASYLRECDRADGKGGWRSYTEAEIRAKVRREYVQDGHGETRTDNVLAFVHPERHLYEDARDLAVYEVARNQGLPDDTSRSHPKIYRADVVDVRNPNAAFLRDSWAFVDHLLGEVDRQKAGLERLDKAREATADDIGALECRVLELRAESVRLRAALTKARELNNQMADAADDGGGALSRLGMDLHDVITVALDDGAFGEVDRG